MTRSDSEGRRRGRSGAAKMLGGTGMGMDWDLVGLPRSGEREREARSGSSSDRFFVRMERCGRPGDGEFEWLRECFLARSEATPLLAFDPVLPIERVENENDLLHFVVHRLYVISADHPPLLVHLHSISVFTVRSPSYHHRTLRAPTIGGNTTQQHFFDTSHYRSAYPGPLS